MAEEESQNTLPGVAGETAPAKAKPHYHGHRQRLRARFMATGGEGMPDYELLELVLAIAIPRSDVKPLAKALLAEFGSFNGVITAGPEALGRIKGMGDVSVAALKVVRAAALRLARGEIMERPVVNSWDRLLDYCMAAMGHEKVEQTRVLFLDKRNKLIADERQNRGTVDHTPLYPREIVKRALELGASAIILVHNHPSGDPTPSRADIDMTKEVQDAAAKLGITLHDHLIISREGPASFKSLGLL
ncbi:MAG: DNA repair protein RadC [Alphaproteobacteria bacterium]|nr:DNA repair protein RadC [Alphaproteobacteria bacterium]